MFWRQGEPTSVLSRSRFVYLCPKSNACVIESHGIRNDVCKAEKRTVPDPGELLLK